MSWPITDAELLQLPIFAGLTPSDLAGLAEHATIEERARDTHVFRRGDVGDALYVVIAGQIAIEIAWEDGARLLALSGPGDWFGEVALISPGPRSADARVVVDAALLRIDASGWTLLAERVPLLYTRLCQRLGSHLRATNEMQRPSRRCVVACGELGQSLPEWAIALRRSVSRQFPEREIHLLGADGSEIREDPADTRRPADAAKLRSAIAEHRGSDCLILIAADWDVRLSDRTLQRRTTTEWLLEPGRNGRVSECIRGRTEQEAIDRVARYVADGVVGLALGAGGAYGFAHVGLTLVLEAAGVPVDCIAGTSMGAILGSMIAAGVSSQELVEWGRTGASRFFGVAVRDLNLRGPTLLSGNGFLHMLGDFEVMRGATFGRLPIPFTAIAMDVVAGDEVAIDSGPLLDGVRASFAMPGIFPAFESEGRVLVDGASVNPVPVDRARELGADFVIASQPIPPLKPDGEDPVKRLLGRGATFAPIIGLRTRIRTVNAALRSFQALWRRLATVSALRADVAFSPDLSEFWFHQLGAAERIVEVGRRAALPLGPEIREALRRRIGLVIP